MALWDSAKYLGHLMISRYSQVITTWHQGFHHNTLIEVVKWRFGWLVSWLVGWLVGHWLVSGLLESFVVIQGFLAWNPFGCIIAALHVIVWRHEMLRKMQSPHVLIISWMPFRMFIIHFWWSFGRSFFPNFLAPLTKNHQKQKHFLRKEFIGVWGTGSKVVHFLKTVGPKANIAGWNIPMFKRKYIDSRLLKKGSIFHWGEIIFQTTYSFGVPAVSFRECRMFEDCRCLKILNQSEEMLAISLSYSLTKRIIYNSGEAVKAYKACKDRQGQYHQSWIPNTRQSSIDSEGDLVAAWKRTLWLQIASQALEKQNPCTCLKEQCNHIHPYNYKPY